MQGCAAATTTTAARQPHASPGAAPHREASGPSTSSPIPVGSTHPRCEPASAAVYAAADGAEGHGYPLQQLHDLQVDFMRINRRQIKFLVKRGVQFNAGAITLEWLSSSLPAEAMRRLEEMEKKKVECRQLMEACRLKVPTLEDLHAYYRWRDERGHSKMRAAAATVALGRGGGVVHWRPQPEIKWAGTVEVWVKGATPAQLPSGQIHAIGIEAVSAPGAGWTGSGGGVVGTSGRPHMSVAVLRGEKLPLCLDPSDTVRTVAVHDFNNHVLRYPYIVPEVGLLSFRDPKDLNQMVQVTALLGLFRDSVNESYILCAQSTVSFNAGLLLGQKLTTYIITHKCQWARTKAVEELRDTPEGQMFARGEAFLVFIQLEPASLPPRAPPHQAPAYAPAPAGWAQAPAAGGGGYPGPPFMDLVPWVTWRYDPAALPSHTGAIEEAPPLPDSSPPPLPAGSPPPPPPEDESEEEGEAEGERPPLPGPQLQERSDVALARAPKVRQPRQHHGKEGRQQGRSRQSRPLSQSHRHGGASERGAPRGLRGRLEKVHVDSGHLQRLRDHFMAWMAEAEGRVIYCCDAPRRLVEEMKQLPGGGMRVSEFVRAYMSDEVLVERDGRGEKHCVWRNKKQDQLLLDGDSDFPDEGDFDYH